MHLIKDFCSTLQGVPCVNAKILFFNNFCMCILPLQGKCIFVKYTSNFLKRSLDQKTVFLFAVLLQYIKIKTFLGYSHSKSIFRLKSTHRTKQPPNDYFQNVSCIEAPLNTYTIFLLILTALLSSTHCPFLLQRSHSVLELEQTRPCRSPPERSR
jgi:hypothetical protein